MSPFNDGNVMMMYAVMVDTLLYAFIFVSCFILNYSRYTVIVFGDVCFYMPLY